MTYEPFDAIVVGGGLAGMLTALELRPLRVALVSYESLGEATSSAWAQGGIAAAVGHDDSPALHAADTVAAGAGLVERRVAARLASDAPHAIDRIVEFGVRFDRDEAAQYSLGREAAHSRRRILRAGGDATGAELVRAIAATVRASEQIVRIEGARALEVLKATDGSVAGIALRRDGKRELLLAPAVVLATGGLGGLYRYTTNPTASRGSGIAIAARAGARLADLEFVQFHPTALDVPCDPLPLVTEALRGEGALLVDERGRRIMAGIDPAFELAPRDVVARRVFAVRAAGGRVFLDARQAVGEAFPRRFPTVYEACRRFGLDPCREALPVVAAAHYHMGGIAVDLEGRTNVRGLYACGEVAATGVHGANRLASNSLLESVVYPERIARDVRVAARPGTGAVARFAGANSEFADGSASADDWRALRDEMYANVGVERDAERLAHAVARFEAMAAATPSEELRDAASVAALVATAALARCESRGSHQRTDYPATASAQQHRSFVTPVGAAVAQRSA